MSSMVRSQEADSWITEGSESENSPRTENSEYSPDNRCDGNLQLSPHSLEIANYRKRKIKAIRETEFVKKCKHNYKSGNIIIHSSEDESVQVKDGTKRNLTRSEKQQVVKPLLESPTKPPNPYSKVFYHNRQKEDCNMIHSSFSFKSLFSCRKRSCRISKTNTDSVQHSSNSLNSNNNLGNEVEDQLVKKNERENINKANNDVLEVLSNTDEVPSESCVVKDYHNHNPECVEMPSDSLKESSSRNVNIINDNISNGLTRTKSFESLQTSPSDVSLKRRTRSFDSDMFTECFIDGVPSHDESHGQLPCVDPAQEISEVRKEIPSLPKEKLILNSEIDVETLKKFPLKELRVVLERIDVSKYLAEEDTVSRSEMNSNSDNLENGAASSDLSDQEPLPDKDVSDCSENEENFQEEDKVNSLQDPSLIDGQALLNYQDVTESNDNERSGNVHPSINNRIAFQDDNSNSSLDPNQSQSGHQSSDKLTNSAPPSSSRPASPASNDINPKRECRVTLERLNMSNIQGIMRANNVHTVNIPAYFLHLKDSSTKLKCHKTSDNHYVRLVDDGPFLKVVSVKNSLEMFQINNTEVRHLHLDIDNCKCPLSKKLSTIRGWNHLKEEINKNQNEIASKASQPATSRRVTKKIQKVVRSKMKPKVKTKLIKKYVNDSLKQIPESNSHDENSVFDSRDWPKSKTKLPETTLVGKVRSMEMVSPENTPRYVYHQPVRTNPESVVDTEPSGISLIPSDLNPISRPSNLIDIYSVKGMIKKRKEQVPANKGYDSFNLNSFYEEGSFNFKGSEHVVAETFAVNKPDYLIRSELLSEELSRCPLINYDYLLTRPEELDKVTDTSQDHLVNSYNEMMALNICKEKQVLTEIEKTITSNKRKSELDRSTNKKQKLSEEDSSNSSTSDNLPEGVNLSISSNKGQSLRVKDMSFLMPSESNSFHQVPSNHAEEPSTVKGWSSRPERQQKKVSNRREWYLKEQMKKQQLQNNNVRSFSLSKLIGVALNQNPSHIDINRTFNLNIVQVVENNQNRLLFLTKEGATEEPLKVFDSLASKPSGRTEIPKKSLEERSNLLKSLSRLHQQHSVFTPSALPSNHKTVQHQNRRMCLVCRSKIMKKLPRNH